MSHMTKAETKITNCNEQLLRQAVAEVAKEDGLSVTNTIKDYYNKDHKVTIGLTGPGLRGIGFNIVNGKLETFGDSFSQQTAYNSTVAKVVQNYVQGATVRTLTQLGYRAQARTKQGEKLVVTMVGP